jgi:archaellum component FlaC
MFVSGNVLQSLLVPVQDENSRYAGPDQESQIHNIRERKEYSMQDLSSFVKTNRAEAKVLYNCHISVAQFSSHVKEIISTHEDVQSATKTQKEATELG